MKMRNSLLSVRSILATNFSLFEITLCYEWNDRGFTDRSLKQHVCDIKAMCSCYPCVDVPGLRAFGWTDKQCNPTSISKDKVWSIHTILNYRNVPCSYNPSRMQILVWALLYKRSTSFLEPTLSESGSRQAESCANKLDPFLELGRGDAWFIFVEQTLQ